MPRFILQVTLNRTQSRFVVTANSVRLALVRLFQAKPQFDVASDIAILVSAETDEDIT